MEGQQKKKLRHNSRSGAVAAISMRLCVMRLSESLTQTNDILIELSKHLFQSRSFSLHAYCYNKQKYTRSAFYQWYRKIISVVKLIETGIVWHHTNWRIKKRHGQLTFSFDAIHLKVSSRATCSPYCPKGLHILYRNYEFNFLFREP